MKISELEAQLEAHRARYGDLDVVVYFDSGYGECPLGMMGAAAVFLDRDGDLALNADGSGNCVHNCAHPDIKAELEGQAP